MYVCLGVQGDACIGYDRVWNVVRSWLLYRKQALITAGNFLGSG